MLSNPWKVIVLRLFAFPGMKVSSGFPRLHFPPSPAPLFQIRVDPREVAFLILFLALHPLNYLGRSRNYAAFLPNSAVPPLRGFSFVFFAAGPDAMGLTVSLLEPQRLNSPQRGSFLLSQVAPQKGSL